MKILLLFFLIMAGEFSLAQSNQIPQEIQKLVIDELISSYSSRWKGYVLEMKKEDIISIEISSKAIDSCDFSITGFVNKPEAEGKSVYQYWMCVAKDQKGNLKAALVNDIKVAEE